MEDHIENVHEGRTILCNSCGYVFRSKTNWNRHKRENHQSDNGSFTIYYEEKKSQKLINFTGNSLACDVCHVSLEDNHMKRHHIDEIHRNRTFHCDKCPEVIHSYKNLALHNRKHQGNATFKANFEIKNESQFNGLVRKKKFRCRPEFP